MRKTEFKQTLAGILFGFFLGRSKDKDFKQRGWNLTKPELKVLILPFLEG